MEKLIKVFSVMILLFSMNFMFSINANAATKVMWGKTELKLGQIGKVTILSNTTLVKIESNGSLSEVRPMKKGEEYRVYSYKSQHNGLYGVGGGSFVKKDVVKVKYETPSKAKLALLKEMANQVVNPKPTTPTTPVVENGLEVIPGAPTTFSNCTNLKVFYPNGVKKGHPAYASSHDRDKDGWACESN
ncbi:excalibur calcium-binding domain-containing protein [Paenisporosarcina sp. NPDC076898]|uniref:excalibur calcium-binding domain-containing protein n=1 Tax=unclassified Paenisporosarcina TaxID=2642018 RepID=UPI003D00A604